MLEPNNYSESYRVCTYRQFLKRNTCILSRTITMRSKNTPSKSFYCLQIQAVLNNK